MDYLYNVAIEGDGNSILIDWNNDYGWMQKYAAELASAERISLIPIDGSGLPVVTAMLGDGKRWIIFSRVLGTIGAENQVRVYCIGWQKTIGDTNIKSLTWVYPNGSVENADQPTLWKLFIR